MTPAQEKKAHKEAKRRACTAILSQMLNPLCGGTGAIHVFRIRGTRGRCYDVYNIKENCPTWLSMHVHNITGFRYDKKRECLCSGYEDLHDALRAALGFSLVIYVV